MPETGGRLSLIVPPSSQVQRHRSTSPTDACIEVLFVTNTSRSVDPRISEDRQTSTSANLDSSVFLWTRLSPSKNLAGRLLYRDWPPESVRFLPDSQISTAANDQKPHVHSLISCQLCLTTSLLTKDGKTHEGPTLLQSCSVVKNLYLFAI